MRSACSPALRSSRVNAPNLLLTCATCLRAFLGSTLVGTLGRRRRGRFLAPRTTPPTRPATAAPAAINGARRFEPELGSGAGAAFAALDRERFVDWRDLARG